MEPLALIAPSGRVTWPDIKEAPMDRTQAQTIDRETRTVIETLLAIRAVPGLPSDAYQLAHKAWIHADAVLGIIHDSHPEHFTD